jgi:putative thioredoxin
VLTPLLEKVVEEYHGALRLVRINLDEAPLLSQQLRIRGIPLVIMFIDSKPVDNFIGLLPEKEIRRFTDRYLAS